MGYEPWSLPRNLWAGATTTTTTARVALVLQAVLLLYPRGFGVLAADLLPFGPGPFSWKFSVVDDRVYALSITQPINVAGEMHDDIYGGSNGAVFYNSTSSKYNPPPFPITGLTVVGGLWDDIDINYGGDIWAQDTTDADLLSMIQTDVRRVDAFFDAGWAHILTYDQVFAHEGYPGNNSFQIVSVADTRRNKTYSMIILKTFEWYHATTVSGFNYGDGIHFVTENTRDTEAYVKGSNFGVPGKYIYRIDSFLTPTKDSNHLSINEGAWLPDNSTVLYWYQDPRPMLVRCRYDLTNFNHSLLDYDQDLRCGTESGTSTTTWAGEWDGNTHTKTVRLNLGLVWDGMTCRCKRMAEGYETYSVSITLRLQTPVAPTLTNTDFTVNNQADTIEVEEGTSVVMGCSVADARPHASVRFRDLVTNRVIGDKSTVFANQRVQLWRKIECADMGQYVCGANNSVGTVQTDHVIEIRTKCLELIKPPKKVLVGSDYITTVSFPVRAYPRPATFKLTKTLYYYADDFGSAYGDNKNTKTFHPTQYLVSVSLANDDVMWEYDVKLEFIDFALASKSKNRYTFTIGNEMHDDVVVDFTTVKMAFVINTANSSSLTRMLIVGIVGVLVICIIITVPIVYWYYACTQGKKATKSKPRDKIRTESRNTVRGLRFAPSYYPRVWMTSGYD